MEKAPMPLRKVVPSVSEAIAGVVMQALAKTPEERPVSAAVFREQLDAALYERVPPAPVSSRAADDGIDASRDHAPEARELAARLPVPGRPAAFAGRGPGPLTPLPVSPQMSTETDEDLDWQTYAAIAAGAFLFGVIALILFKTLT